MPLAVALAPDIEGGSSSAYDSEISTPLSRTFKHIQTSIHTYKCQHSRWLVPFAFESNIQGGRSSSRCDSKTSTLLSCTYICIHTYIYTYICYHLRWLLPLALVSNIKGRSSSVCDSETIVPLPRTFWRSRSMAYSERSDLCSTRWGKLMRWNSVSLVCVYVCYLIFIYIYMSIHTHTRRARTCA